MKSHSADMRALESARFLYQCGQDPLGRPVVMLSEHTIPATRFSQQQLLRYIISFLEPISAKPFCMVYCHAGVGASGNILEILKELIRVAQFKY